MREDIEKIVTSKLSDGPLPLDVVRCIDGYDPRAVTEVIRMLIDEEVLSVDVKNTLSLND